MDIKNILKNLVKRTQSYIVETGEEDGWHYIKYNDGWYDAYKKIDLALGQRNYPYGALYAAGTSSAVTTVTSSRPSFDIAYRGSYPEGKGLGIEVTFHASTYNNSGAVINWIRPSSTDIGTWTVAGATALVNNRLAGKFTVHIHGIWK